MENFSEVIKIIEAGFERDREKLIAYSHLLMNKINDRQQNMIISVIDGSYKKKDIFKVVSQNRSSIKDKEGK